MRDLLQDAVEVRKFTVYIGILGMLFVILISILVSSRLTNPIRTLQRQMKAVESGVLSGVEMRKPTDELGDLSNSFNDMVHKLDELIKEEYILQLKEKDADLRALQAQITPHFLYNTLEMIDGMAEESRVRNISTAC